MDCLEEVREARPEEAEMRSQTERNRRARLTIYPLSSIKTTDREGEEDAGEIEYRIQKERNKTN